jgi:hypothetical protein
MNPIMRVITPPALAFCFALAGLQGCGKNTLDSNTTSPITSSSQEDDAADVIAAALGSGSTTQGFSAQLTDAATLARGGSLSKSPAGSLLKSSSVNFDTTIVRTGALGNYSWNYRFNLHQAFLSLTTMEFGYGMKGTYDTPILSSNDSANAFLTLTGLQAAYTVFTVNGSYLRLGSETSKIRNKSQLFTTINLVVGAVDLDKSSGAIVDGTLTGTISGDFNGRNSFSWSVQVTFNGNGTASLVVNGKSYTINLSTARVV